MTRTATNSLAAIAAVFLALTSIGTIVDVPPAHAHNTAVVGAATELA